MNDREGEKIIEIMANAAYPLKNLGGPYQKDRIVAGVRALEKAGYTIVQQDFLNRVARIPTQVLEPYGISTTQELSDE